MAEPKTEQEPSIEEILESIRQIISDDTEAAPAAAAAEAPKKPAPAPAQTMTYDAPQPVPAPAAAAAAPAPSADDTVIDLVDVVPSARTTEIEIDLREIDDTPSAAPEAAVERPSMGGMSRMADNTPEMNNDPDILSDNTADAATAAMARLLASNIALEKDEPSRVGRVTLEDLAREMMRPLIKDWLDKNLPRVIEKIVAREVEKLSRRALDQ